MCQAITEMIEDGRREGWRNGEYSVIHLTQILLKNGQVEVLEKAMKDETYRKQLYKKYKLQESISEV